MIEQIIALNQRLQDACEAYYGTGETIMSDAEYDVLEAELRGLVGANPEYSTAALVLKKVGSAIVSNGGRVSHLRPMLSIENHYSEESFLVASEPYGLPVALEPKYDGISDSVLYESHQLVRALTRGDGTAGEDITENVKALKVVPLEIPDSLPANLEVRGELAMETSELERINREVIASGGTPYKSSRNLVAGTLKLKDVGEVGQRLIRFKPWDCLSGDTILPDSHVSRMALLATAGFAPYQGVQVSRREDVMPALQQLLKFNAASDIYADGVVIKTDSHSARSALGNGTKYTHWQHCFKPQGAVGETHLRGVIWQVGRVGTVVPVGIVDPITLAGAEITRVNLNNISWIEGMGLKINSRILLVRSGDVIPVVLKVLDDGLSE